MVTDARKRNSASPGGARRPVPRSALPNRFDQRSPWGWLLACWTLLSAGCQGLGIPSYRIDGALGGTSGHRIVASSSFAPGPIRMAEVEFGSAADRGEIVCDQCPAEEERIGLVPPLLLGGSLCRMLGIRKLPDPPPYPRFHPLPTRPVFSRPIPPSDRLESVPSPELPAVAAGPRSQRDAARRLPSSAGYRPYPIRLQDGSDRVVWETAVDPELR